MPTEIAAHASLSGVALRMPLACKRVHASCNATYAPQMLAVRVPPSACNTSQSSTICNSGISSRSTTERNERPMRRWISCVRPDCFPLAASRSTRVPVEPGSNEYSAVTHPLPVLRSHGGTRSSTDAVHNTRVLPKLTSTDPGANSVKSRWKISGRRSSGLRPSLRVIRRTLPVVVREQSMTCQK